MADTANGWGVDALLSGMSGGDEMKQVIRYQCELCKKEFKTPDRHYCKKNPKLKNCFTCKHLKGWLESEESVPTYFESETHYIRYPNYPDCAADVGWDIEIIKSRNYNMQCEKWEAEESEGLR